jgi:hypothetical protein
VGLHPHLLEEALGLRVATPSQVGRFDQGPDPIGGGVVGVAFCLALGGAGAVDAAGLRGKVADLSQAGDIAHLPPADRGPPLTEGRARP